MDSEKCYEFRVWRDNTGARGFSVCTIDGSSGFNYRVEISLIGEQEMNDFIQDASLASRLAHGLPDVKDQHTEFKLPERPWPNA